MFDLRSEMAKLPRPTTSSIPPYWEYWRMELWDHVVNGDNPNNFFDWPCIRHTMSSDHFVNIVIREQHEILRVSGKFPADPTDPNPSLERNNIRQIYHLWKWEQVTGKKIADLESIVEIGGGYGAMCKMAGRMGFQGTYTIFDLPEFSLLQQWYLDGLPNVKFVTAPLPKFFDKEKKYFDLLVGIYSLSEMPMWDRDAILFGFPAWNYCFLYSGKWETYDNVDYFQNRISFEKVRWHHEEATHHFDRNNWYALGWTE